MKVLKARFFWLSIGSIAILGLMTTFVIIGRNSDPALLTGTIDLTEQNDLPSYSKLVIQLRDSNNDGRLIAEHTIDNPGQENSPFEISYNPNELEKDSAYIVLVKAYDTNNQLLFTSDTPLDIDGLEEPVTVGLKQPVDQTPSESVSNPKETPPEEPKPTVITPPDSSQPAEVRTQDQPPATETETETTATAIVNVYYDREYNLPPGAKLTVNLRNLGQPRSPLNATTVAEEVLNPSGSPPIAVELTYNADDAPPDSIYLISVAIHRQDGKQLMTNSTFGFEMNINQIDGADVHLITVYPDEQKLPEDLDASVSGSIRYKKSCQLPAGSKLTIQLRDVSYQDTPSPVIAEQEVVDPGSSPVRFELGYDSDDIEDRNLYSISGQIRDPDGELLFINDTIYEVITRGNPVKLGLPLVAVGDCR